MKKGKFLKRVICIVMLLCLVVFGNFVMKAMVNTEDGLFEDNQIAAEEMEAELDNIEAETQSDNGKQNVDKVNTEVQYEYDKLNRLTKVIYGDGSTVSYEYDKNGNIVDSVVDAVTTSTPEITTEPTVEPTQEPANVVTVYYANSSWDKAYVHYKVNEKWTTSPGKLMETTTEVNGYTWKYTIDLGSTDSVTLMFTDGNGTWDKNSDGNKYVLDAGVYGIKNYTVSTVTIGSTTTPTVDPTVTPGKITTVYYANSSWSKAYVHYKVDGKWTTSPGRLMETTTEVNGYTWKYTIDFGSTDSVTLMFTDGNGTWDKNSDGNKYILTEGTYGIENYKITSLSPVESTPKITATPMIMGTPSNNIVTVYYKKSSFSKAYIHYKVGAGSWTTLPGVKMAASNLDGYTWMYTINLGTAANATVCFNDGAGNWDSNNGSNYKVYVGRYGVKSGVVYDLNY